MKKTTLSIGSMLLAALVCPSVSQAQFNTPWSTGAAIGIGTTTPVTFFHVNADVRFQDSTSDFVQFTRPNGETGMSMIQGTNERADLRFNGSVVKLAARPASGLGGPAPHNGIAITTNYQVGISNDNPAFTLTVNDSSGRDYGAWVSANSNGPAVWIRRDSSGYFTGSGLNAGTIQFALNVENVKDVQNGGGLFSGSNQGVSGIATGAVYAVTPIGVNGKATSSGVSLAQAIGVNGAGGNADDARGVNGSASSASLGTGVYGTGTGRVGTGVQGLGFANSDGLSQGVGVDGWGISNNLAIGVKGWGWADNTSSSPTAIGVLGQASLTSCAFHGNIYAVLGTTATAGTSGCPHRPKFVGAGDSTFAGFFQDDVFATNVLTVSDIKFKENIKPIDNSLDIISKLNPKTYTFKQSDDFQGLNFSGGTQYGLIAQELEQVLPQLVKNSHNPELKDRDGNIISKSFSFKAVNYMELIPILIDGIKQQQQQITDLEQRLNSITATVNDLKATVVNASTQTLNTKTVTTDNSYLEQNVPNPLRYTTSIRYHLATGTSKATLQFVSIDGKVILTKDLAPDSSQVDITTTDWVPGTYSYILFANGTVTDAKKMVVAK